MNNIQIADLLTAVAAAYKIHDAGKNRFKIVAYERAADAVEHLSSEAKDLWDDGELQGVSGIGPSIAQHLGEIFETGKSKHFDELFEGIPPATFELIKVSGVGPKTAIKMTTELGVKSISDLQKMAKKGEIAKLEGFGEDSEKAILESIGEIEGRQVRLLLPYAQRIAEEIIEWLQKDKNVTRADALGSLRRRVSTVGDVDLAVATSDPQKTIEHFSKYPNATRVLEKGERTASIIIPGDRQVDLLAEKPDAYGAVLQHFTGSKHHNIALRTMALKKKLSLSDYGIYKVSGKKKTLIKIKTEEEFYKRLDMEWIPPELREVRGEIEAAKSKKLPDLVELKDIKADLQIHSSFDIETSHDLGASTMQEVIKKANSLKYEYLAFTEHNPAHSKHTEKQIVNILKRKQNVVEQINTSIQKRTSDSVKKVFNSLEIDILPDGTLPVPDEGLETLDFALVSIHSSFKQSREKMTKRVLKALDHPRVQIFAHPTGRKLNEREGVELDWEKVFDFCRENNKWIEINADPSRLDLPDHLVKEAVDKGIKLTLGTDAHHVDHMDNMQFGVWVARRGWCETSDIINARSLNEFYKLLKAGD